ncbi:MAG: response regulator [Roseburia sp.]|nr:response regulator [Roseburia sp.]
MKKLEIVLVEDDKAERENIVKAIENLPDDFSLVGSTDNAAKAFELVTDTLPDAVILDLELHRGGGDGLSVLEKIKHSGMVRAPFILVTTNNISELAHSCARELGADFIMTKNQDGYSAKAVCEFLKNIKPAVLKRRGQNADSPDEESATETAKRIRKRLCAEFNKVGISTKVKGHCYLLDAVMLVAKGRASHMLDIIANKYGKTESSVERAMQNAISQAWRTADIDDLYDYYTAKIAQDKGAPTVTEFVYYYAHIIENEY